MFDCGNSSGMLLNNLEVDNALRLNMVDISQEDKENVQHNFDEQLISNPLLH